MRFHRQVNSGGRYGDSLSSSSVGFVGMISILLGVASGQEIGADLCACAPGSYNFTLDLGLTCPPINVTNAGVAATFCQISTFDADEDNVTDLVPVVVDSVDILELGQDFTVLHQNQFTGTFGNGDSFSYTSVVQGNAAIIPRVLQLHIVARNAENQSVVNSYAIAFTNDCLVYPVLTSGNSAGWTLFTFLSAPPRNTCPAVPGITSAPPPTGAPTRTPVSSAPMAGMPSAAPTRAPTVANTSAVTVTPTDSPTVAPATSAPTGAPTGASTTAPTAAPTVAPTVVPTVAPTGAFTATPTMAPTVVSTVAPTVVPSPAPTVAPTGPPTVPPTTSAPTGAPTNNSTSAPTGSPTASSTTSAPTMEVGMPTTALETTSPTASSVTGIPTASHVPAAPTGSPDITAVPTLILASPTPTTVTPATPVPAATPATQAPTLNPVTLAPSGFSMSMEFDMDLFQDLFDEFGRSSVEFFPPSLKSPKMVPRMKKNKISHSSKTSTKVGKKRSEKGRAKAPAKSGKKAPKADQASAKTSKAESGTVSNAEKDVNSSKAEPKGKKRRLRLTHRVG